jgi:ABC-type polysaccharide/polyol phosphate export permease
MCGLLPWNFFTSVINGAMSSLTGGSALIKKVYFPRMQLPFAMVGSTGFTWLNEMGLLVVIIVICGATRVLLWLPLLIVYMALLALFAAGLGMMLSIVNVYFRDTEHFVSIALRMLLYLTPVMYPLQQVASLAQGDHAWILTLFELNPIEHFMAVFRNLLYDNRWPNSTDALWCSACAIISFVLGFFVFKANEKKLAVLL